VQAKGDLVNPRPPRPRERNQALQQLQ
jgi:hypothetical protein